MWSVLDKVTYRGEMSIMILAAKEANGDMAGPNPSLVLEVAK